MEGEMRRNRGWVWSRCVLGAFRRFADSGCSHNPGPDNLGRGFGVIHPTWKAWYWTFVTLAPVSGGQALRKRKMELVFRVFSAFSGVEQIGARWKKNGIFPVSLTGDSRWVVPGALVMGHEDVVR